MSFFKRSSEELLAFSTSVKKVVVRESPSKNKEGIADFVYQPVFSVFDYGTINPPIPLDNSTVCLMAGFNFELLRERGVESHFMGLVTDEGELISAKEAVKRRVSPSAMRVKFVNRILPEFRNGEWSYSSFHNNPPSNYVHPIEFISRNEIPESSSVWKRVERREISLNELGLPGDFRPGEEVPDELKPILDYSTKFEKEDRYLTPMEAQEILGISSKRFEKINNITIEANRILTDYANSRGFKRLDGKVEYITFFNKSAMMQEDALGDAVCTWHEDRLTVNGIDISKQLIRKMVRENNPLWYEELEKAKRHAREEKIDDFRSVMDPKIKESYRSPSALFFERLNTLFRAGTNQWVGSKVYDVFREKSESIEDNLNRAIEEFQRIFPYY